MVGMGRGASLGIFIKNGEALEHACKIDTIILDKTGTITEGRPVVEKVIPHGIDEKEFLHLFACGEASSEDPLARAVTDYASEKSIPFSAPKEFEALAGRGGKAIVDGKSILIGNERLFSETEIEYAKIGIVKQHRRRYKVKKEYEPRKFRKYNRRNNRRGGGYAKIQPWKIKKS